MSGKPWHTDRWFVSPWNYLPEATRGFQFAERIQIHDLTLNPRLRSQDPPGVGFSTLPELGKGQVQPGNSCPGCRDGLISPSPEVPVPEGAADGP